MAITNNPTTSQSSDKFVSLALLYLNESLTHRQSRPLTYDDMCRIKVNFPDLYRGPYILTSYDILLQKQDDKMIQLLSDPEKEHMAPFLANWTKEMQAVREVWSDWFVTLNW